MTKHVILNTIPTEFWKAHAAFSSTDKFYVGGSAFAAPQVEHPVRGHHRPGRHQRHPSRHRTHDPRLARTRHHRPSPRPAACHDSDIANHNATHEDQS